MIDKDLIQTKGHDPELLAAFEEMCRENEWKQADVISYLLESAVLQNQNMALPFFRWLQTRRKKRWQRPQSLDSF